MKCKNRFLLLFLIFTLFSVSAIAQTREIKTKDSITVNAPTSREINNLVPNILFPKITAAPDTVSLAQILFNPEITLINPDTFKVKKSLIHPDSTLLKRDSLKILDIHPQDVLAREVLKVETKSKKTFIIFYGSIRVSGQIDYNGLESPTGGFNPYYIPVGEGSGAKTFGMSASQTRFGLEGTHKTVWGPVNFKIEGDFRGNNQSFFRLRHAYGQFINVLAGQTWSVFGDPSSVPWTVDLEGPNSSVNPRSVQVRYSNLLGEKYRWMASLEAPQINYKPTDSISPIYQTFPDIAIRLKNMTKWGHLQAAIVMRSLGVKNQASSSSSSMGFGALISGRYEFFKRSVILGQLVGGKGISRYIRTFRHADQDLVYNPKTNSYDPLPVFGGFISIGNGWRQNIYSYLTAGFTAIKNKLYQQRDAFSHSAYFSINTFWDITKGFRAGAEYSFGSRVNNDNESNTASRLSFILYYSF